MFDISFNSLSLISPVNVSIPRYTKSFYSPPGPFASILESIFTYSLIFLLILKKIKTQFFITGIIFDNNVEVDVC